MDNDTRGHRDWQSHAVIDAALRVHRALGHGFLEGVHQEALELELTHSQVPFDRQVSFPLDYRGLLVRSTSRADLVCFGSMIVELKALRQVTTTDEAQVINYLKASGLGTALLFNFGTLNLQFRR